MLLSLPVYTYGVMETFAIKQDILVILSSNHEHRILLSLPVYTYGVMETFAIKQEILVICFCCCYVIMMYKFTYNFPFS